MELGAARGRPDRRGTFDFTVLVEDNIGGVAMQQYSISVAAGLMFETVALPSGMIGEPYSAPILTTGGVGVHAWTITQGSLPAGLTLDPSPTSSTSISGTPTSAGYHQFEIEARDSLGSFSRRSFTIHIRGAQRFVAWVVMHANPTPIQLSPTPPLNGDVSTLFAQPL